MIETIERPLSDIPGMIASGEICHSMIITAFALMGLAAAQREARGG
jgi:hypothetical protein